MKKKKPIGLYSIDCFDTRLGLGMGMYGFSITLAEPIVSALLKTKRSSEAPLLEMIKNQLVKSHKRDFGGCMTGYFEDTWLLTDLRVEGNCACFGIDGNARSNLRESDREQNIKYNPHNIDSPEQAAIILSAWLVWFNSIITLTEFELPFAM
jgi:hypothetical protein